MLISNGINKIPINDEPHTKTSKTDIAEPIKEFKAMFKKPAFDLSFIISSIYQSENNETDSCFPKVNTPMQRPITKIIVNKIKRLFLTANSNSLLQLLRLTTFPFRI